MFAFLVSDLGTLVKCVCVFVYAWDIHVCVNSSYTDIFFARGFEMGDWC